MAGHIPSSGSVSMGPIAGDTRSMYRLRNLKRSTGDTSQQNMSTLRDWFRTYVNPAGDAGGNFPNSGNQIAFSDFYDMKIWRVGIRNVNESASTYSDSNNAQFRVYGSYGSNDFAFHLNGGSNAGWQYPSGGAEVLFTGFNGGSSYTFTARDEGGPDADFTLTYYPGYNTATAYMRGTTTSGSNNTNYNWSTNSPSSWSEYSYFYVEEADPSGVSYG